MEYAFDFEFSKRIKLFSVNVRDISWDACKLVQIVTNKMKKIWVTLCSLDCWHDTSETFLLHIRTKMFHCMFFKQIYVYVMLFI